MAAKTKKARSRAAILGWETRRANERARERAAQKRAREARAKKAAKRKLIASSKRPSPKRPSRRPPTPGKRPSRKPPKNRPYPKGTKKRPKPHPSVNLPWDVIHMADVSGVFGQIESIRRDRRGQILASMSGGIMPSLVMRLYSITNIETGEITAYWTQYTDDLGDSFKDILVDDYGLDTATFFIKTTW
jgi:hypothetical protein